MTDEAARQLARLLEEIRDNQRSLLDQQTKAFALQLEQFELVKRQTDRQEQLQDRAEQLQASGAQLVGGARKALILVLPIIIVLLIYVSWLLFRI